MIQKYIKKLLDQDETLLKRSIVKNKNNKYILNSKYKIGKIIIKKNIAEFITQDIQKVFIDLDNLNGAYNDDIVLVQMIFNPRSRTKAKVVNIVQRNVSKILCFIENGKCYSVKEKIELNFDFKIGNYKNGDILLIENNRVHKDLGNINDTKVDEQISLFLYNQEYRNEKYSTDINDEFNTTKRIDLTHLPFCTIDPATAKDHDDAIYFDEKENILYVAIADVSAFIKEGSTLDLEARKRAFSIYFPNKVMPMIPFSLSADLCSLKPNVKRFAFVFKIKLDTKKLKVTTSEVFEAIIKSQNKYSYETINEVLKNKISGYEQLLSLYEITTKFRSKRLQNGFDFRTQELQLTLDDNENLQKVKVKISSSSHKLVEECML